METFTVNQLAELTQKVGNRCGRNVMRKSVVNPRKEAEEHYYNPKYWGFGYRCEAALPDRRGDGADV